MHKAWHLLGTHKGRAEGLARALSLRAHSPVLATAHTAGSAGTRLMTHGTTPAGCASRNTAEPRQSDPPRWA